MTDTPVAYKVLSTTDGQFIGHEITFDEGLPGFLPEKLQEVAAGLWRLSNSNYVVDAEEI